MEDNLSEQSEELILSDREIFTKIWTSPRIVFKYINDNQYDKYVTVLLIFSGISRAFDRASMRNMGDDLSLWGIIGICVVFGGLLGWFSYYLYAAMVSWTGKWLNGQGNTTSILRILSFAMLPSIIALILLVPQIGVYGVEIFKEEGDITSAGLLSNIFVYGSIFLEFVLGVWTIVLSVVGVSEVQKLPIGKTILNLLLPVIVIVIPILILVLLFRA